jgi:hypothetical protein
MKSQKPSADANRCAGLPWRRAGNVPAAEAKNDHPRRYRPPDQVLNPTGEIGLTRAVLPICVPDILGPNDRTLRN